MLRQPHYVREYRRMVRALLRETSEDDAMSRAVGGDYEKVGCVQAKLLREIGLRDADFLIDVGCGAGRTAFALRDIESLRYHGTDVVPELLRYAERKVARPDWRFSVVEGLTIPEKDATADMVAMFSVLTHLTPAEGQRYLADAVRALRPGGIIVASFLDAAVAIHREVAGGRIGQIINRLRGTSVKNVVLPIGELKSWADALRLSARFIGPERIGQSVCVFTKPA